MHENELFVLLLGTLVLVFVVIYRARLKRLPKAGWLFCAFAAVWVAWIATVVEHLFFSTFFNVIEHIGYALNGVLLLVWCWLVMGGDKADDYD